MLRTCSRATFFKRVFIQPLLGMGLLAWVGVSAGCGTSNLFQFFDVPSSDTQRISKGRACFDRGDYSCARANYSAVTSSSYSELAAAELAFTILKENGVGLDVMTEATGSALLGGGGSGGGALITALAQKLSSKSPGETKRKALQSAYQQISGIPNSGSLRGLVRFLTASALAGELLAETMPTAGALSQSDLTDTPASCSTPACSISPNGCDAPASNRLQDGTALDKDTLASADLSGSPTIGMLHGALMGILEATSSTEMGGGSSLGASTASFASQFSAAAALIGAPAGSPCYRQILISNGVGN